MPVYLVVASPAPYHQHFQVWTIHKVVACDISEVSRIFDEQVTGLMRAQQVQTFIFSREPDNPFRDMVEERKSGD